MIFLDEYKVKNLNVDETYRELVATVIEHVLLGIGIDSLEIINKKLKEEYSISTNEIFDHPESLKSVLISIYGDSYDLILNKIKSIFGTSLSQNSIFDFISRLER